MGLSQAFRSPCFWPSSQPHGETACWTAAQPPELDCSLPAPPLLPVLCAFGDRATWCSLKVFDVHAAPSFWDSLLPPSLLSRVLRTVGAPEVHPLPASCSPSPRLKPGFSCRCSSVALSLGLVQPTPLHRELREVLFLLGFLHTTEPTCSARCRVNGWG